LGTRELGNPVLFLTVNKLKQLSHSPLEQLAASGLQFPSNGQCDQLLAAPFHAEARSLPSAD
jgi:hypothetical protein